jgi:hypothetical protein
MRRALIASVGLVGLAATALPGFAAPSPADEGRTAGIQVTTKLPGGDTLRIDISAAHLSDGPHLVLDAVRCDDAGNCATQPYAGPLAGDALSISASDPQAKLDTTLDGRPLTISWKPMAGGGYSVGGGTLDGDGPDTFGTEYAGTSADATVTYDGASCQGVGGVGNGVVLDAAAVSGTEVARPLSALHLPAGTGFRC